MSSARNLQLPHPAPSPQPTLSKFGAILVNQQIHTVPTFRLESGRVLYDVPVAYKTWGTMNETHDNVMVICHAFTGSADVEDWWGPLMGPGKAFDMNRFFIVCLNVMGSPYGTASSVTVDPQTGCLYGPEFPKTTIRDDVRLHKLVLDHLTIASVAVVIGGSMGGMAVLEWPLCTPAGYIKHIIPIATSARHSAWCISWGEAQRQSIYSDPAYIDGYYDPVDGQPKVGLAAARMAALLTYRSRDSFEKRFGRKPQIQVARNGLGIVGTGKGDILTPPASPPSHADEALAAHNDGHKRLSGVAARIKVPAQSSTSINGPNSPTRLSSPKTPKIFTAQSYLRYQGDKFTSRFDANCYIHITRKLDTHDIARGRSSASPNGNQLSDVEEETEEHEGDLAAVLATLPPGALVISIETDGLFTPSEQKEIAAHIPHATLVTIPSPDGHDGFLLEFEAMNRHILKFLKERLPGVYEGEVDDSRTGEGFEITKTSVFGEAEVDVTSW
ncbi:homoserine O- acetyltransferase [Tulasnella sp. JGI-2019a]|nr:homoserine O- acetyltransferase [Tulasnella sp. JGI-2019a]